MSSGGKFWLSWHGAKSRGGNLAKCQVTGWELGMVPSQVTYFGNLPGKSHDIGVGMCLPPATKSVITPHIA